MNHDSRLKLWLPLIGAIVFVGGLWVGYLLADGDTLTPGQQKLNDIFRMIDEEYVDEIDQDSLIEMTIPGLLHNLDPHSLYVPKDELDRVNRDLESSFYGIGIQFQLMSDSICVVEVISGGPAERVGVQAGDRIIAVDGKPMTGKQITNDDVLGALRGARDTDVTITVSRQTSRKPLDFTITRGEIPSVSVDASYLLEDSIGYVRLSKFAANTYSEFLQALNSLRVKGAKSYVLDLRGNTGGLLDQAILIANEFLEPYHGIVSTKGRNRLDDTLGTGAFADMPLVVLMDEFSASSSEIVAGAIQDNDRGLIIGRRSFGKGLVQRQITLPDSSQLRLTVQRYYTPSGRCIQKDFTRGSNDSYETEIYDRYSTGEVFNADSAKINTDDIFLTIGGREVYGGGGIMPDVFVPSDTTGLTSYYFSVANAGLLQKFAYEYADLNRSELSKAKTVDELLRKLPSQEVLLSAFIQYAKTNGIAPRWYYINNSSKLIVNQLRALIARDILGMTAYFEITNAVDPTVREAVNRLHQGIDATIQSRVKQQNDE